MVTKTVLTVFNNICIYSIAKRIFSFLSAASFSQLSTISCICLFIYLIDIDECASIPCMHGGLCNDMVNLYSCSCKPGYVDYNCEIGRKQSLNRSHVYSI